MLYIFNKIKRIILMLMIFFLVGCEAEYNLEINNNINLKEMINITEDNQETFNKKNSQLYNTTPKDYLETNLKWPTPVYKSSEINPYEPVKLDNTYYYTKSDISNYKRLGISYSFNHNQNRYNETDILNKCYDINYIKNNNIISLETTSKFKCFNEYKLLEKVTINLNTTCKVNKENADKIEKNKYTWNITKENYNRKIIFEVECEEKKTNQVNSTSLLLVFIIGYLCLIGLLILITKILQNKNNKI